MSKPNPFLDLIKPRNVTKADDFFLMLPTGAGLDIITGRIMIGRRGESIIMGGLGPLMGYVGRPNRFKSTLMHYQTMSAMERVIEALGVSSVLTFDSEVNTSVLRLKDLAAKFKTLVAAEVFDNGSWVLSNAATTTADEWYEEVRKYLKIKEANVKDLMVETPFFQADMKTVMEKILPTFVQTDSLSSFQTKDVLEAQENNAMGESGGNMIHARQGLVKTRLMMEAPALGGRTGTYLQYTAHLNDSVNLAQGPYAPKPIKQLENMREGERIKGVSTQFLYLLTVIYETVRTSHMLMQDTKQVRYPEGPHDNQVGDSDLRELTINVMRSKVGGDGRTMPIVISKTHGVDPNLTNFNYIDQHHKAYGIGDPRSNTGRYMELLPEVKFGRTTIRSKMLENPRLARAVEITSEMCQMREFWSHGFGRDLPTPAELYKKLKEDGYDWNVLLDARGYWTFNQYEHPVPPLSTVDLIRMYRGTYKPYWM